MQSRKSILILKSSNDQTKDLEHFLRSRGFDITIVNRAREAIQMITEKKPDVALLSGDLLPARCAWLVGVLNQLTSVVVFLGRNTARNMSVNRELAGTYVLEPPLDPMGLDLTMRRMERDRSKQNKLTAHLNDTQMWIMSTLADLSLKDLCEPKTDANQNEAVGKPVEKIGKATKVVCLRVQSFKISGHFILAHGQDRTLSPGWMKRLQAQFKQYLFKFDDGLEMAAPEELKMEEVDFHQWSKSQAEFTLQSIHQEAEVALAFFRDPVQIEAKPSSRRGCIELGIDQIPEDGKVTYDVFVYLPQNARFILYTPNGDTFSADKKKKLVSQGINSVHISKKSLDEVRRQHAHKYIEESSQAFR